MFNAPPAPPTRAAQQLGDGFLFEQGYTVVWLGWQFDVPEGANLMRLYAPVAWGLKGVVRAEIVVDRKQLSHSGRPQSQALSGAQSRRPRAVARGPTAWMARARPCRARWHIENGPTS